MWWFAALCMFAIGQHAAGWFLIFIALLAMGSNKPNPPNGGYH